MDDREYMPCKVAPTWQPLPTSGYTRRAVPAVVHLRVTPALRSVTHRDIAAITADIRRATVPALRSEDV